MIYIADACNLKHRMRYKVHHLQNKETRLFLLNADLIFWRDIVDNVHLIVHNNNTNNNNSTVIVIAPNLRCN